MPKMIYICILLIYFKVISKKGGHYCPRLPYISRNNLYLDYPHRFLLEICRNHLNNMTLYVNTAISQFGVSNGMEQWCRKTQLQHTQYIVDIPFLLSTKAACQY